jgi:hypothetical protein
MKVETGSYTGDLNDGRTIALTDSSLTPDFVMVNRRNSGAPGCVAKTSGMAGDTAKPLGSSTGLTANYIQALGVGSFEIGSSTAVNGDAEVYDYIAIEVGSAGDCEVGAYTGNGVDDRDIPLTDSGLTPDGMIIMGNQTAQAYYRFVDGHTGDSSSHYGDGGGGANFIQSLGAGTFQVGTGSGVNTDTIAYYYLAWKKVADIAGGVAYVGNGTDGRTITSLGLTNVVPGLCHVTRISTYQDRKVVRIAHTTDLSSFYDGNAAAANHVQDFPAADTIDVGTSVQVNHSSGQDYGAYLFADGSSEAGGAEPSLGQSQARVGRQTQIGRGR